MQNISGLHIHRSNRIRKTPGERIFMVCNFLFFALICFMTV